MDGLQDSIPKQPIFIAAVSYLVGLFCANFIKIEWAISICIVCISFCIVSIVYKNITFFISFLFLFFAFLVFHFNFYRKEIFFNSMRDKNILIVCHAIDFPSYNEENFRYIVEVDEVINNEIPKFKMEISSEKDIGVEPFRKFKIMVRTSNVIDIKRYLYLKSQNILISGFASPYSEIEFLEYCDDFKRKILIFRENVKYHATKIFNVECSNLVRAFLFGDKKNLDKNTKNLFYKSGISHLLAISGFHFSLLTKILYNFLKFIKIKSKISNVLCILFILFYSTIVGFHPSSVRAAIMLIVCLLSQIFFLRNDPINSVGIALILILFFNPNASIDIGLFLSFISSISIILFSEELLNLILKKSELYLKLPIFRYIISNVLDSILSTLAILPVICIYFKYLNPFFIISNLLISFQIYLFFTILLISIFECYLLNFTFFGNFINIISNSILFSVRKISAISPINLDYGFINLCVSSVLILVTLHLFSENLKKELLKLTMMSLILLSVGVVSYKLANIGSIKIYANSSDMIFLNEKGGILVFQSKNIERMFPYLVDNSYKINCGSSKIDCNLTIDREKIYEIRFWNGNLKMLLFHCNGNLWIRMICFDKTILACVNGADAKYLPEKFKKCDILILFKMPNNFKLINCEKLIYLDRSYLTMKNYAKLPKNSIVSSENKIFMILNKDKYIIKRSF